MAIRTRKWPAWPRLDDRTEELLLSALGSRQWTISSCNVGSTPFEMRFAQDFAHYHDVPYCVATTNGSAALSVAMQALGVSPGDEVLVPGLTWVACASSVIYLGGIPVLVDVDPGTLCMSLAAAEAALTPRTKGIMLVHLHCRVADAPAFQHLARRRGLFLLEDCSQAHGAEWDGKKVGSFGDIGVFSMHQSKVLTCGEGGAAITSDPKLFETMQEYRADGRRYSGDRPA